MWIVTRICSFLLDRLRCLDAVFRFSIGLRVPGGRVDVLKLKIFRKILKFTSVKLRHIVGNESIWQTISCKMRLPLSNNLFGGPGH